jgi:AraC family transcriptional regulator
MPKKPKPNTYFVQVVERPERKLILKRGVKAVHYFEYCLEVGNDVEAELNKIKGTPYEPCGIWLPKSLRPAGTSEFVMGLEVPSNYKGRAPKGFEILDLKPCPMMVFQGPPFEDDTQAPKAIMRLWAALDSFNPELYGYAWADEDGPRFQMHPKAARGHIELLPVKKIKTKNQII